MENIEWLNDASILQSIGNKVKEWRLEQDLSQRDAAIKAGVALSTVQSIEYGKSISLENLIRILRILGRLDILNIFLEPKEISPLQYQKFQQGLKHRERASKNRKHHDTGTDGQAVW